MDSQSPSRSQFTVRLLRFRWVALGIVLVCGAGLARTVFRQAPSRENQSKSPSKPGKKGEPGDHFKRPPVSVVERSGLANLEQKLRAQTPVTIGFIGGSITQNAGDGGFVSAAQAWLSKHSRGGRVDIVNAGVAATGSDFGAQRVDRDVLVHVPDVVFVEFAVNDSDRACVGDMERLVRKIRTAGPLCDIVFLYTVMDWSLPLLEQGKYPISVRRHEFVAAHYGIASVALGFEAARKIREGEWTWADFSKDACHPTPAGYASYNQDIEAALPLLLAAGKPGAASLPPPLTPGLVMHPEPAKPLPEAPPEALLDDAGRAVQQAFHLPGIGAQWITEPRFPAATDSPMWRLEYRKTGGVAPADTGSEFKRSGWKAQRWFDETRSFTGSGSLPLAQWKPGKGNRFGAVRGESAILVWRAPSSGAFLFEVSAPGLEGPGFSDKAFTGIQLALFPGGAAEAAGVPVAEHRSRAGDPTAFRLRKRMNLTAGDEVAVLFAAKDFKYAFYEDFRVAVGHLEPEVSTRASE
jgi:lysophospholipase L1-like esterase